MAFAFALLAIGASAAVTPYPFEIDYGRDVELYSCVSCRDIMAAFVNDQETDICHRLPGSCERIGKEAIVSFAALTHDDLAAAAKKQCQELQQCPVNEAWEQDRVFAKAGTLDLRVAKAYGAKGYNFIRISSIANKTAARIPFFTYDEEFKYRWTNKRVQTVVKPVVPGTNVFHIDATNTLTVNIPAQNAGVRGLLIADPCYSGEWIGCQFTATWSMFAHSTALINAFMRNEELSFFGILGDNFYDRDGHLNQGWFDALTPATKSKLLLTVPGNHDFWVHGGPAGEAADQFGNGLMQFYAQDTAASKTDADFLDFSVNPDAASSKGKIAHVDNFFFYHMIGNLAFVGFSGAHTFPETKAKFEEACVWLGEQKPAAAFLLGHWNNANLGCGPEMTTPAVYSEIKSMPGCAALGDKLRYFMGHEHCNEVTSRDVGFMIGGNGMGGCGRYGIPVIDTVTHPGRLLIMYFPINDNSTHIDKFAEVHTCVESKGYSGCIGLATPYLNVSLTA